MENKTLITIFIIALISSIIFLGATITGLIIYKVEYNDLCKTNENCFEGKECCIIYEDKNLGVCMEQCKSFEFLCQSDEECEKGTICCLSEEREYGICNYANKCLDVDIFAEYIGSTTFLKPEKISPRTEKPTKIDLKDIIAIQTIIIIILIGFIILLLNKKKK